MLVEIIKVEWKRISRSWITLGITFLCPILLIVILGFALSGPFELQDVEIKQAEVVVYSEDNGVMNDLFHSYLQHESNTTWVLPYYVDSMEAFQDRIRSGHGHVGVHIPKEYSNALLAGEAVRLEIYSGTGIAKNITSHAVIQRFLDVYNRIAAEDQVLQKTTGPEELFLVYEELTANKDFVIIEHQQEFGPVRYFSVHVLIMFLFYSGLLFAVNLLFDRQNYIMERMYTLPVRPSIIVIGKMVAYSLLALLQAILIIGISTMSFEVDWGNHYELLFLVCGLVIIASMSLALILVKVVGTLGGISSIFNVVVLFSAFVSGGMFPIGGGLIEKVASVTLNYWASLSVIGMMLDYEGGLILQHLGKVTMITAVLFIVAAVIPDIRKGGSSVT